MGRGANNQITQKGVSITTSPRCMYRITAISMRDEIKLHGFSPVAPSQGRWEEDIKDQPAGVYLWADEDDAHAWAEITTTECDIWEIDTQGMKTAEAGIMDVGIPGVTLLKDMKITYPASAYYCIESIAPERLTYLGTHRV